MLRRVLSTIAVGAALAVLAAPLAATSASASGTAQTYSTDCYHSVWGNPHMAAELDVGAYGAAYDCSTATWTFPVVTRDSWPDTELSVFLIQIDSDADPTTGCQGFEWTVLGTFASGQLQSQTYHSPSCDSTSWTPAGAAGISRASSSSIRLSVANALLNSPNDIRWRGFIQGKSETSGDHFPDVNASPNFHEESGFASGVCSAPLFSDPGRSMLVTDQPAIAARVLRTVAADVVSRGEGVISFRGDAVVAENALVAAGIAPMITPDAIAAPQAVPNDPGFSSQWALSQVGASKAWDITKGNANVVVADIDSGVDATHPDLAGKLVPGFDATTGGPLAGGNSDPDGHGTATAGVIGAATDNGTGLASLGWNTTVMPIKAGDHGVSISASVAGLRYAADHGAKVANLSFGSPCRNQSLSNAVAYAESKDVLLVAASGNDRQAGDYRNYPAAEPGVLAVGATGFDGQVTPYSNFNNYLSLVAPGGSADGNPAHDIVLLAPGGGTVTEAGTSFSAPLVAAAAALVRAVRPDLKATRVSQLLTSTATQIGPPGRNSFSGYGLVNPAGALTAAANATAAKPLTRLFGQTRIGTAIAVSQSSFPNKGSAVGAVLTSAATFADALPGTPLAVAKGGPLLLTGHDSLDPDVATELQRVLPSGATVYLLGGGFALSDAVASQVQALGYRVVRYAGQTRYETATIIADKGLGNPPTIIEATGLDFPDALAAGAAAAANNAAVLLTAGNAQAPETAAYLSKHAGGTKYALGGQAAAADPGAQAIVGADRFETSVLAAKAFFANPSLIGVASGETFPDALSGGANIGGQHAPMILVPRSGPLPAPVQTYLQADAFAITVGLAYGGGFVLGDDVLGEVQQAIS